MKGLRFFAAMLAAAALAPFMHGQDAAETASAAVPVEKAAAEVPAESEPAPEAEKAPETLPAASDASGASAVPAAEPSDGELTENQKKQLRISVLKARQARVNAEIALGKARLAEKLAPQKEERARLEAETSLRAARTTARLAEVESAKKKLDAELALDKARNDLELFEKRSKVSEAELDLKISRLEQEMQLARFSQGIEQVKAAEALRGIVVSDAAAAPAYRKDPLENGKLYISDRRIEFNGPVTPELAEHVVGRIYFYNNQNAEYPIFIVIDNSPGGSVAAGYQIMKAMESSKAPVYVVVKSYAASMAAMITTFAERSFCYGNTVLLQHQPSSGMKGNLTQMREGLDSVTRWTRNINDQLAKKMGMTYEEYVAEMYKHDSRGDWSEFGDGAQRWKWVTDVVDAMEETSIVRKNDGDKPAAAVPGSVREYKFDERGKPYVEPPTPPAGDLWMLSYPANPHPGGIMRRLLPAHF